LSTGRRNDRTTAVSRVHRGIRLDQCYSTSISDAADNSFRDRLAQLDTKWSADNEDFVSDRRFRFTAEPHGNTVLFTSNLDQCYVSVLVVSKHANWRLAA